MASARMLASAALSGALLVAAAPAPAEPPIAARLADADPAAGEAVFRRCAACHVARPDPAPRKLGPNLWGVVGRPVGRREGFRYSKAMADHGGTWDFDLLDAYLADPRGTVPGTRMVFPGIADPQQRADVIAWLRARADDPAPLPGAPGQVPARAPAAEAGDLALLAEGEGRRDVLEHCAGCHSLKLVVQQGLSRRRWDEILDWMVEEQAMDPMAPGVRSRVLDYLSTRYGVDSGS